MKRIAAFIVAAALSVPLAAPAQAFDRFTMFGQPRLSGPVPMGYVRLPFHGTASRMPRAGVMLSSPGMYSVDRPLIRSAQTGVVDFGVTRRSARSRWTPTVNVSDHVAWAGNPDALPKDAKRLDLMGGSTTWIIVGVASAALATAIMAGSLEK
jgi:hypothetical protein